MEYKIKVKRWFFEKFNKIEYNVIKLIEEIRGKVILLILELWYYYRFYRYEIGKRILVIILLLK